MATKKTAEKEGENDDAEDEHDDEVRESGRPGNVEQDLSEGSIENANDLQTRIIQSNL